MGQRRDFGQTCGKCPSCGSEYVPEMGEGGGADCLNKGESKMWYVMQVYTGHEAAVCRKCREEIVREEEEVFVPLAERMTKIKGEWVLTKNRLFPGYVFVETENIEDFHVRLKQLRVMTKVLTTGEYMTPLYAEEEAHLQRLLRDGYVAVYSEGIMEGNRIVVIEGALKGFEGRVKKVLRHKRLAVLEMPLMGRTVEVTVGLGIVERRQRGGE